MRITWILNVHPWYRVQTVSGVDRRINGINQIIAHITPKCTGPLATFIERWKWQVSYNQNVTEIKRRTRGWYFKCNKKRTEMGVFRKKTQVGEYLLDTLREIQHIFITNVIFTVRLWLYWKKKGRMFNFEKYCEKPVLEKRIAIQYRAFEYRDILRYRYISPALI